MNIIILIIIIVIIFLERERERERMSAHNQGARGAEGEGERDPKQALHPVWLGHGTRSHYPETMTRAEITRQMLD